MNNLKAQLRMHYFNSKKSFIIFWSIIFAITIFGFALVLYLTSKGHQGQFTGNNMFPVVIFGAISSMVCYNETLPYTLSMGRTRKSFIFSFAIYNILLSLSLTIIFCIFSIFEHSVFKLLGLNQNNIGNMIAGSSISGILLNLMLYFSITLAVAALFALISGIHYLKGMMFVFGIGAAIMLIMLIPGVRIAAFEALKFIVLSLIAHENTIKLILISLTFFLGCYIILYPIVKISQVKR